MKQYSRPHTNLACFAWTCLCRFLNLMYVRAVTSKETGSRLFGIHSDIFMSPWYMWYTSTSTWLKSKVCRALVLQIRLHLVVHKICAWSTEVSHCSSWDARCRMKSDVGISVCNDAVYQRISFISSRQITLMSNIRAPTSIQHPQNFVIVLRVV